jgi:hypothetical protein
LGERTIVECKVQRQQRDCRESRLQHGTPRISKSLFSRAV